MKKENYIYHENKNFILSGMILLLSGFFLLAADLLQLKGSYLWFSYILFGVSFILSGSETIYLALINFVQGKIFDESFLISMSTIGALLLRQFPEAVFVMLFYQIGYLFQDYAIDKSLRSIESLIDIVPDFVNSKSNNKLSKEYNHYNVNKIINLVKKASSKKTKTENFISKFTEYYTPILVIISFLVSFVPPLFLEDGSYKIWIYKGLTFLVLSCPCALISSVPISFFGGLCSAAKSGILIKESNYLESLANAEVIIFNNTITQFKEDSKLAIIELKNLNIKKTVLLTEYTKSLGEKIRNELGVDLIYTELSSTDKLAKIQDLSRDKTHLGTLVSVIDNLHDAPLISQADVGIYIGCSDYDTIIDNTDVVIFEDHPLKISTAIKISKKTLLIARGNIFFALSVKIFVLILTILGLASMWEAIFTDVCVSIITIINALRTIDVYNSNMYN